MDSKAKHEELLKVIEAQSVRITSLENSLEELARRIDNLVGNVSQSRASQNGTAATHEHAVQAAAGATPSHQLQRITPGLAAVIRLIAQGHGEEAHRMMRELPQEELAEQPAVVTLAVAALCIQKGDFNAGLKALEKARTLTDDPRLLRVIQAVEQQIQL